MFTGVFDQSLLQREYVDLRVSGAIIPSYFFCTPDLDVVQKRAKQLRSWGLEPAGHPIIYMLDPTWPEVVGGIIKRITRTQQYADIVTAIGLADVVNEPLSHPCEDTVLLYKEFRGRSSIPRRINETGILSGENTAALVGALKFNIGLCEYIGVQAHVSPNFSYSMISSIFTEKYMEDQIKAIASLGLPIHISEMSVPSSGNGWTQARQASFIQRIFLATHKYVDRIYYWEVKDKRSGMFNPISGLIDIYGKKKKAYNVFKSLADA